MFDRWAIRPGLFLWRASAIDQIGQILARAFNNRAQFRDLLRILERHATGDDEEARHFHGLTAQRLQLRRKAAPAALAHSRPRWPKLFAVLPMLVQQRLSLGGDAVHLFPIDFLDGHEAAILQHLQRGVDRTGAGRVKAAGAFLQRLDHLVAVHWAFQHQLKQSEFHVSASKDTRAFSWPKRPSGAEWRPMTKWPAAKTHGTEMRPMWPMLPGRKAFTGSFKLVSKMFSEHYAISFS